MSRHDLTITEWNAIRNYLPKKRSGKRGRPWVDHRRTINGIICVLNAGAPWRDIPDCYGKWQTIDLQTFSNMVPIWSVGPNLGPINYKAAAE